MRGIKLSVFTNDTPIPAGSTVTEHLEDHDRVGTVRSNGTLNHLDWVPSNPGTPRTLIFSIGCWNATQNNNVLTVKRLAPTPIHVPKPNRPEADKYTIELA